MSRTPIPYLNNNLIIFPFFFMLDFCLLNIMISILEDSFQSLKKIFKKPEHIQDNNINLIEMIKNKFIIKRMPKQSIYFEYDPLQDLSIQTNRLLEYITTVKFHFKAFFNKIYKTKNYF